MHVCLLNPISVCGLTLNSCSRNIGDLCKCNANHTIKRQRAAGNGDEKKRQRTCTLEEKWNKSSIQYFVIVS